MAPMPSLKVVCAVPYRGSSKNFSMKMHFSGGLPPDSGHWHTLAHAVWDSLKQGVLNTVEVQEFVGYANDTSPSVWNEIYTQAGVIDASAYEYVQASGAAVSPYWTTDQRNSRGGPIYLRNFLHGVIGTDLSDVDAVHGDQRTPLVNFAHQFSAAGAGFSDGATTYHRAGPNGAVGQEGSCTQYVGRRILARRG